MDESISQSPEPGRKIALAFKLIRQAYSEAGNLLYELDDFMTGRGWRSAYGNTTTGDISRALYSPRKWLTRATYRYYERDLQCAPESSLTRLGITIVWCQDEFTDDLDPFVILGRTDGFGKDMGFWDLWNAWFQGEHPEKIRSDQLIGEIGDISFRISTCFLTTIASKQDVALLGQKLIDLLELDSAPSQDK